MACLDELSNCNLIITQEMESIFGMPPSVANHGSSSDSPIAQEPQPIILDSGENELGLTHVDRSGGAQMVDICAKEDSKRVAIASCRVTLGEMAFNLVAANQIAKGDVLNVAKIAGISAAKQTSNLIPLCHNISLTHIHVDLKLNEKDFSVDIEGEAATTGKTGVEMEAMTAVTVAGLTVYDMCKAASKDIQITDVRLERKSGGKSGEWSRKQ
ncbi:cyclic pyranopterin monophosphate synthase, mitochondrial isoform X2 [Magnolia sinica]|uniref:cyclic pyranopterin monophosphate synthase, mitochondrial isoform X2 n=1 Tax=Magnolia sinica TaxID=86752 RepID=UPI0026596829|nr:cyclic pyranopterin monophosphate synthase, mitochondrial isoform X2 [Magnolia sinica]